MTSPTLPSFAVITHPRRLELAPVPVQPLELFNVDDLVYMVNDRPEIVWKIVRVENDSSYPNANIKQYHLRCPPTRERQLTYTVIVNKRDIAHVADRP